MTGMGGPPGDPAASSFPGEIVRSANQDGSGREQHPLGGGVTLAEIGS